MPSSCLETEGEKDVISFLTFTRKPRSSSFSVCLRRYKHVFILIPLHRPRQTCHSHAHTHTRHTIFSAPAHAPPREPTPLTAFLRHSQHMITKTTLHLPNQICHTHGYSYTRHPSPQHPPLPLQKPPCPFNASISDLTHLGTHTPSPLLGNTKQEHKGTSPYTVSKERL